MTSAIKPVAGWISWRWSGTREIHGLSRFIPSRHEQRRCNRFTSTGGRLSGITGDSSHQYPRNARRQWKSRGYHRTFCRECPFKTVLAILKNQDMSMICDAGCSVLGMTPPYELGVASYGMGASIAVAARSTRVALIGDYALLHSGLNALVDVCTRKISRFSVSL